MHMIRLYSYIVAVEDILRYLHYLTMTFDLVLASIEDWKNRTQLMHDNKFQVLLITTII